MHQLKIAKATLQLNDAFVAVMGGMDKQQARDFLERVAGWSLQRIQAFESGARRD